MKKLGRGFEVSEDFFDRSKIDILDRIEKEEKRKMFKFRAIFKYSAVAMIALVIGLGAGSFISVSPTSGDTEDVMLSQLDDSEYEDIMSDDELMLSQFDESEIIDLIMSDDELFETVF